MEKLPTNKQKNKKTSIERQKCEQVVEVSILVKPCAYFESMFQLAIIIDIYRLEMDVPTYSDAKALFNW